MKIVINKCFGGFGLSHEAIMLYAKLSKFKLYPFVAKMTNNGNMDYKHFESYHGQDCIVCHYSKKPLKKDGTYIEDSYFSNNDIERNDPILIKVVKKLGEKANTPCSKLDIVEIPDDVEWEIDDYDGQESVHEKHRSW